MSQLLGLRHFLTAESPLKMMKNAFYLMLKALLVLRLFGHVGKRLENNAKVNFKICDVTDWQRTNYNTHNDQYLMK